MSVPEVIGQLFNSPLPTPTPTPSPVTIDDLMSALDTAYQQGHIGNNGIYTNLSQKLKQTKKHLERGEINKAIEKLEDFIKQVEKQRGKQITPEAADSLLAIAQQLIIQIQQ